MKRTHPVRIARSRALALLAIAWVAAGPVAAQAQNVANDFISGFEIAPAGSLEWDILDRLAATRQYEPGDLRAWRQLTVLESIAMYRNLRSDLRETSLGARIEGEIEPVVGCGRAVLRQCQLSATGSRGAESHAGDAGRRQCGLPASRFVTRADLRVFARRRDPFAGYRPASAGDERLVRGGGCRGRGAAGPRPRRPRGGTRGTPGSIRRSDEDLGGYIAELNKAIPVPADRDALIADANGLLDLLQGFDRTLVADPSNRDLVDSLRLVRRRMWSVESRIVRNRWGTGPAPSMATGSATDRCPLGPVRTPPRDRARPCRGAGPGCQPHAGGPGRSSGRRAGRVPVPVGCRPEGDRRGIGIRSPGRPIAARPAPVPAAGAREGAGRTIGVDASRDRGGEPATDRPCQTRWPHHPRDFHPESPQLPVAVAGREPVE